MFYNKEVPAQSVLRNFKVSSVSIDGKVLIQPFLHRQCLSDEGGGSKG